jgi:hypothetical protein
MLCHVLSFESGLLDIASEFKVHVILHSFVQDHEPFPEVYERMEFVGTILIVFCNVLIEQFGSLPDSLNDISLLKNLP